MRRGLIFLLGIMSFLGINTVSAEEIYLEYDTNINEIKPYIDEIGMDIINSQINSMINYYNENLSQDYHYYFVSLSYNAVNYEFRLYFTTFSEINYSFINNFSEYIDGLVYDSPVYGNVIQIISEFNSELDSFSEFNINQGTYSNPTLIKIAPDKNNYKPYNYYYSNFDLYYKGSLITDDVTLNFLNKNDDLYFPKFNDSTKYSVYKANSDFLIEPYYLYDDNSSLKEEIYTSINLNDYSYVALSLKDYSKTDTFYTNMYVKGQLCLTPVYNYGMTEKNEYYSSYQNDRCSPYYEDFTLVRTYILADDLKNNAIFYLKAHDTSKENLVKIDTSVFDITYITEDNKDNPYVSIGGKTYPTIAYDDLTSSATKSEDEDYISGVSCQVGDFNCYKEYNPNNVFDDLFDKPLKMLKTVWGAIISIFNLIAEFIALLPPTMQGFLYISFGIAIILGIIKILL